MLSTQQTQVVKSFKSFFRHCFATKILKKLAEDHCGYKIAKSLVLKYGTK